MKAYKGFKRDMTCRGFQYKEGETYHTDDAKLCESGFHACEYPLDVLAYYPPNSSVYYEVELDEVSDEREDDSKVCAKTIRVGARMDIASFVKASVEYTMSKCNKSRRKHVTADQGVVSAEDDQSAASATGYQGAASATGGRGAASATGVRGAASATGYHGAASATGSRGAASATGVHGAASATGGRGAASATGGHGAASATGVQGAASATGSRGAASATGYQGAASATGYQGAASADSPTAIAVSWGVEGRAKGVLGAHIVCAEWQHGKLFCAKMARVDGVVIKPDTYYTLTNGEFVEESV